MPRAPKKLHVIEFHWPIPAADRRKVEEFLCNTLGYDVDGGSSSTETATAEIYIRPKARSHKRKSPTVPPAAE